MKGCLRIIRNNEVKLTVPGPSVIIKKDGTLWVGENPILAIDDQAEKTRIVALIKAGKYSQIPVEYFIRLGENENGRCAVDDAAWAIHPARLQEIKKAEAKAIEAKKTRRIYLSSRGWGDYSPVEWIGNITRPATEIFAECKHLLETGYDVDRPDLPDEKILADIYAEKNKYENPPAPIPEPNHGPGYCYSCETYCYGDCGNYTPKITAKIRMGKINEATREQNYGMED